MNKVGRFGSGGSKGQRTNKVEPWRFYSLNAHKEKNVCSLCKKLEGIYKGEYLVNKLFLRKMYSLKIDKGVNVVDHLNFDLSSFVIYQCQILSHIEEKFGHSSM